MISIDILTKNGTLVKLQPEEAEEVYAALKTMFDKSGDKPQYPTIPYQPYFPYYPNLSSGYFLMIENVEVVHDGDDWKIAFDLAGQHFEEKPETIQQTIDRLITAVDRTGR